MESLSPFPVTRFIHFGDFRYYYAYGNTPPDDLLQNAHGAEEPNILLLGCGDLRSCFYTLWKNLRSGISKHFEGVHFVLNDNSSAVIARDIIFLHLCLKCLKMQLNFLSGSLLSGQFGTHTNCILSISKYWTTLWVV